MALQVWLPLNGNLNNQGLSDITVTNNGVTVDNNGKIGKCYSFNSNKYLSVPNPITTSTTAFSIATWVYVTQFNNGFACVCSGRSATSGAGVAFWVTPSYIRLDDGAMYIVNATISTGTWVHVCATWSSSKKSIYLNGQELGSSTSISKLANLSANMQIGSDASTTTTYCLNGKLNDFRIYDHALSPKEIKELAKGLVCHYPLNGANDTLLPFGYQQLDYIEGAGAAAFDTTYKFNPETDSVKITFKGNDTSNNGMLFGQSAGKYFWLYYYGSNGIRVYADNGSGQQSIAGISSDLNKHTAEYKNKHYYIDGTDKGSLSNVYAEQPTTSWIFSYSGPSYGFKGKIYYAQIRRSGVPQRTFIPAKRLSDSKIGMYDISNNVFYSSNTSTAFTAGDVVGTPTTTYDCSGYQNNGTINGSLTVSSDTARYSVSTKFDGSSAYIESNPLPSETKTISIWLKTTWAYPPSGYRLAVHDKNTGLAIGWSGNSSKLITYVGDSNGSAYSTTNKYLANQWNHVVVIKTGSNTRDVYINGEKLTTAVEGTYWGGDLNKLNIGNRHNTGVYSAYWDGQMSDFRAYATALSAEQIAELYNTAVSVANNGTLMGYELVEV